MNNKLKVGDKVKVIKTDGAYIDHSRMGHIGTIENIDCTSIPYKIVFEDSSIIWAKEGQFDRVRKGTEAKPSKPAPVKFLLAQGNSIREFDTLAKVKAHITALMEASWNRESIASIAVYEIKSKRAVVIGTKVTIK